MKKIESRGCFRPLLFLLVLPLLLCGSAAAEGRTPASGDPASLFKRSGEAMAAGDFARAIELLSEIPEGKGDPEGDAAFVKSRIQMAKLRHALGEFSAAAEACDAVLARFPENVEAQNFRAALDRELEPAWRKFLRDTLVFIPSLVKGAGLTLMLVLLTMTISPFGGLIIALGRISTWRPVSSLCWFIIWLFRGTPLLLQLFFIYYGLPALGITLSPVAAAILGLALNYSAYLAEIIRSGILSIDAGQMEAAKAIGMSYTQAMRRVIIPQTYKRLMPPIGNEFIALIKDTALVSTISMVELMRSADRLFNTYFNINVLILAAIIYLLFTTVFTVVFEHLEEKVGAYENR